jgi:alpha-ketoglutarate-dependent taurine dioxygenase
MSPEHDLTKQLTEKGWITFESSSPEATAFTISALGPVIQKTDVQPRLNARAALATDLEMELHSDYPRACWIAWHCVRQSSAGGMSLLKDARRALLTLPPETRLALETITMGSHQVFPNDPVRFPVVRQEWGIKHWISYTPWFRREGANEALDAFVVALQEVETETVLLKPGQVLLIDNTRLLHGRTGIEGDKDRLLIRHWIGHPQDHFDHASDR